MTKTKSSTDDPRPPNRAAARLRPSALQQPQRDMVRALKEHMFDSARCEVHIGDACFPLVGLRGLDVYADAADVTTGKAARFSLLTAAPMLLKFRDVNTWKKCHAVCLQKDAKGELLWFEEAFKRYRVHDDGTGTKHADFYVTKDEADSWVTLRKLLGLTKGDATALCVFMTLYPVHAIDANWRRHMFAELERFKTTLAEWRPEAEKKRDAALQRPAPAPFTATHADLLDGEGDDTEAAS